MVGITGKRGTCRCRADVDVVCIVHRQRLAQAAGTGHGGRAGSLGCSVVGHAGRATHRCYGRSLIDRERSIDQCDVEVGEATSTNDRSDRRRTCGRPHGRRTVRTCQVARVSAGHRTSRRRFGQAIVRGRTAASRCGHRSLVDLECLRVIAAGVVGVPRKRCAGRRRADIHVIRVGRRQRLAQATRARHRGRARRLGRSVVGHTRRAAHRSHRGSLIDSE